VTHLEQPIEVRTATVIEVVAAGIAKAGVDLAFAFPGGGGNLGLMEALRRAGVNVVLTHSEEAGAFMAATYGELTGKPGVLIVGVGPGAASAVNGAAHALLDRAPMLLITDRYSESEAGTSRHQLLDHRGVFQAVTKWSVAIRPDDASALIEQALRLSTDAPRGPVHLDVARDVASRPAEHSAASAPEIRTTGQPEVEGAAAALREAEQPLVLVGLEATHDVRQADLVRLAERLCAPVAATYKGKGVFPETHDLSVGIVTGAAIERGLLERADAILGVGFDPIELLPRSWPARAPFFALRSDPADDPYLRPKWTCVGQLGSTVARLADAVAGARSRWTSAEVRAVREGMLDSLRLPAEGGLAAWEVVEATAAEAPEDTILAVDAGAHMFAATWFWRATLPRSFLISNGLATMGYAVPAALCAAIVHARDPVIAFTGDGGFLLHGNELETAARLGVRIIVVVLNDASLSLIRVKQEDLGLGRAGLDYVRSDFAAFGRSLGVRGTQAGTCQELRSALREALKSDETTVIDVQLTGSEYVGLHKAIRG
jgi:acetolactate synthase-1/2/3 large subunit